MNLPINAAEDHKHGYQKEGRNKDVSKTETIDQQTFIKGFIISPKKKWVHKY